MPPAGSVFLGHTPAANDSAPSDRVARGRAELEEACAAARVLAARMASLTAKDLTSSDDLRIAHALALDVADILEDELARFA